MKENKIITLSKQAIEDLIIEPEVSNEANYNKRLQSPTYPGGASGITIGLGYDIGHQTTLQLQQDLSSILSPSDIVLLQRYCGKTGYKCQSYLPYVRHLKVSWDNACKLFYNTSLHRYARLAANIYPELETLHPYEQTAIVGLVYNRGISFSGSNRVEMYLLRGAIIMDDDKLMADLIRKMKRLWVNKGLDGLLKRRDLEAYYVEMLDLPIPESDKLILSV